MHFEASDRFNENKKYNASLKFSLLLSLTLTLSLYFSLVFCIWFDPAKKKNPKKKCGLFSFFHFIFVCRFTIHFFVVQTYAYVLQYQSHNKNTFTVTAIESGKIWSALFVREVFEAKVQKFSACPIV